MSIEEFGSNLRKNGVGPGATWHKADFHIHAPASSDYEYRGADANEQLVLKHQEFPTRQELADLRKHCHGALFIPAHLHQSKSPDTSRSTDDVYDDKEFLGFVSHEAFDALEVRQLATAEFFDGTKKTGAGLAMGPLDLGDFVACLHRAERASATTSSSVL